MRRLVHREIKDSSKWEKQVNSQGDSGTQVTDLTAFTIFWATPTWPLWYILQYELLQCPQQPHERKFIILRVSMGKLRLSWIKEGLQPQPASKWISNPDQSNFSARTFYMTLAPTRKYTHIDFRSWHGKMSNRYFHTAILVLQINPQGPKSKCHYKGNTGKKDIGLLPSQQLLCLGLFISRWSLGFV